MVSPALEGGSGGGEPTQPSLRRLREHEVRPRHDLGQNFLIDSNMLEVIGSLAAVGPDDTVLEVGGGLGVLSEYLAPACGHLHVIEVDPALEPALAEALAPFENVTLTVADVMDVDAIRLDEVEEHLNPMGSRGAGEIGIVGAAAAVVNAVYHATGVRVRELPVTLDKVLPGLR